MARLYEVPPNAREVVISKYPDGSKQSSRFFVGRRLVTSCFWNENGRIALEVPTLNGVEREWHENGRLQWKAPRVNGRMHGLIRQWDHRGKLIGKYRMNHGTGIDLWWDEEGTLSEERHFVDGKLHGPERWWFNCKWVHDETWWQQDKRHGIKRSWTFKGKLEPGYPKFYIADVEVSRSKYERAAKSDPTLIPYSPKGDVPRRRLPPLD